MNLRTVSVLGVLVCGVACTPGHSVIGKWDVDLKATKIPEDSLTRLASYSVTFDKDGRADVSLFGKGKWRQLPDGIQVQLDEPSKFLELLNSFSKSTAANDSLTFRYDPAADKLE